MSLRSRIEKITTDVAIATASNLMATKYQQVQNNSAPMGTVVSIDGQNITMQMDDGSTVTSVMDGSRQVGIGTVGMAVGGIFR